MSIEHSSKRILNIQAEHEKWTPNMGVLKNYQQTFLRVPWGPKPRPRGFFHENPFIQNKGTRVTPYWIHDWFTEKRKSIPVASVLEDQDLKECWEKWQRHSRAFANPKWWAFVFISWALARTFVRACTGKRSVMGVPAPGAPRFMVVADPPGWY